MPLPWSWCLLGQMSQRMTRRRQTPNRKLALSLTRCLPLTQKLTLTLPMRRTLGLGWTLLPAAVPKTMSPELLAQTILAALLNPNCWPVLVQHCQWFEQRPETVRSSMTTA